MEIRQLEYFQVVASFQSMTKAAAALHITQPALSRIIKRLEEDIGFELFERQQSGICLSAAGETFLAASNEALSVLKRAVVECNELVGISSKRVSVSVSYEGAATKALKLYHEEYPTVLVQQSLHPIEMIQNRLLTQESDFGIAPNRFNSPGIHWASLCTEELLVMIPEGHPLFGRRSITLEEMATLDLLFNEAVYDRGTFEERCREHAVELNVVFQSNEHSLISYYMNLMNAKGSLFIPAAYFLDMLDELDGNEGLQVSLPTRIDPPVFVREIGIAYLKGRKLSKSADEYAQFIIKYYSEQERLIKELLQRTYEE